MTVRKNLAGVVQKTLSNSKRSKEQKEKANMDIRKKLLGLEPETVLENRLRIAENYNMHMYKEDFLLEDIYDSNLPDEEKKKLYFFVKDKFKKESIKTLCYSRINRDEFIGNDYIKRQLEETARYACRGIESLREQLREKEELSENILSFLEEYLNKLKKVEEVILSYYSLERCPICGSRNHIYENVRNYGAYIGVSYCCLCQHSDIVDNEGEE